MKKNILEYIIIGICMMPYIELSIADEHEISAHAGQRGPACPRSRSGPTDMYPTIQDTFTDPINERGYKEIFSDTKEAYTIKSFVNTVSNVTYTTAIIYFWIHLIKTIRVIYNDLEGFSYYVWISLKLSLHITVITLYLYILFYVNEETENNGIDLMFIIGSIEYILDQ